ncbi:MAG: hypothetical protein IPN75_10455 [Dechloromonas sp.]|uniref:O-acyltransferase WSD1-like N-terminal domain-containing protein n=1 Tax=Candidatus Dechloromonas phosphorivorans TaxID=2899244 RepID=A0A9D7LRL1_9RHOO|nr:hypothetical protein [Candidatus Dechloromonas phosphorivorans]
MAKKSLLQPLYDAYQTGSEVLPGLGSGLLDVIRGELGKGRGRITLPLQAPPTPFNVEITGSRRFVAQSYSLERIKRLGAVAEATVNDVTLALCASALRQYLQAHDALPGKSLTAMVPVSLHGETSKEETRSASSSPAWRPTWPTRSSVWRRSSPRHLPRKSG